MTRNGQPVVGLGQVEAVAPVVATASPWGLALATSVVGAAAGWCIEEVAKKIRKKRRHR
jgi:mannitol-specific phosphotransferase system IIBC component